MRAKLTFTYPNGTRFSYSGFTLAEINAMIAHHSAKSFEVVDLDRRLGETMWVAFDEAPELPDFDTLKRMFLQ